MRTILLGTHNSGKVDELRAMLGTDCRIVGLDEVDPPPSTPPETAQTYYENALSKALYYHRWTGLPTLADDSGLEVSALKGAPGVHSASYGGERLSWAERNQYLLDQWKRTGAHDRSAVFRCVLCFYDGKGVPTFFEGNCPGELRDAPSGEQGFGYDPVVYVPELGMTFGEAAAAQKNQVSHRARALRTFREWLDHAAVRG